MLKRFLPLLISAAVIFWGCEDEGNPVNPQPTGHALYIVNSNSQTISMIDLETDSVYNDLYITGQWPAEIDYFNGSLYIANSGDNTLQIIDIGSGSSKTIELGDDRNPVFFEFINDDEVAISNWLTGTVSFVNIDSEIVEEEIWVGAGPWGMAYYNGILYIGFSNYDPGSWTYGQGRVAIVDAATRTLLDSIDVGTNPGMLFFDQQGELNVVCIGDYFTEFGSVWRIDPTTNTVLGNFDIGKNPAQEALAQDGTVYLAAGGELDPVTWLPERGFILAYNSISETVIHGEANPLIIEEPTSILGAAIGLNSDLYVSSNSADEALKIDSVGNIIQRYAVGDGPERIIYVVSW